jgi:hypothetical protein
MAFIGNTNITQAFTPAIDYFSGTGSATAFTLSRPVASVAQVQAVVNNVAQNPSDAFTVSGSTITFTSAPSSGTNNIYVYYTSPITQVIAPGQGTVTTTSLASSTGSGAVALASLPTFSTTIGVGGATASASGSGITFPATQSASSDANTLDDYEEGTWTPVLVPAAGSITTQSSVGVYTKIGNTVYCSAIIYITTAGTASGTGQINGLPFTSTSFGLGNGVSWFGLREDGGTGNQFQGEVRPSATYANAWSPTNGALVYGNTYQYVFSLFYKVA